MRFGRILSLAAALAHVPLFGSEIHRRIVLAKNGTGATVTGRIPRTSDAVVYEFACLAGRHYSIRLEPGRELVAQAILILPSGIEDGPGVELAVDGSEAGTCRIRIVPRQQTAGSFRLKIAPAPSRVK